MSEGSSSEDDSDDDIPIGQLRRTNIKSERSSASDSDDAPLVPRKKKKKKKAPRTPSSSSSSPRHRKRKRFGDSDDEDSSSSDSDDDRPIVSAAKTIKAPPRKRRRSSGSSSSRSRGSTPSRSPSRKNQNSPRGAGSKNCHDASKYTKKAGIVPLEPQQGALRWWEEEDDLTYEPHGVPMLYDGDEVALTPDQEEIATMFAMVVGTDWEQKPVFRRNFFKDFTKILRDAKQPQRYHHVTDLEKCDFSKIVEWYTDKKEAEKIKRKTPEYKALIQKEKADYDSKFGFALVDGVLEKVGNYKVEPPGLFRGRGEHPKMGMLKDRIMPRHIILNIGEGVDIPPCPLEGQEWGGVVHDPTVTYIAKWVENINGSHKFVYLGASSRFKGQNDRNKYEKARVLKTKIDAIRKDYETKLSSKNVVIQQLATAVWMIDRLSIRTGNEKDTDEEADTVGVCSLRKEHLAILDPADVGGEFKITLDFLGKDSMRYFKTLTVTEIVHQNLKKFIRGKHDDHDVFEKIDSTKVNDYLKEQMENLTAKVFRTHNASTTLQIELAKGYHPNCGTITKESTLEEKKFYYDQCNKTVAILCNHQRSVSKSHAEQLEKMDQKMADLKQAIKEKEEEIRELLAGDEKKREKLEKQLARKREMLRKKELAKALKEDNKEVALGTSKINYMDPRITVAWCKRMQVPIEKIFNKSLLDKFPWAMQATTEYDF